MRSARMVLATATATAALALAAPAAYADHSGDGDHDKSSYSKEYDKESKHDKPHGGVHTGGGALTAVSDEDWGTAKDPKYDPETYKEKGDSQSEDSWSGKHDSGKEDSGKEKGYGHEKPRGGMHTGGGALAEPAVTAGGLAALAVLGTGAYALRRKKVSGNLA
ncbi:hypothetical protein ACWDUB_10745 [Streptomyces fungicidicus]